MYTSRDHHSVWSVAVTVLVAASAAFLFGAGVAVRARFFPYGPCPTCSGRRGRSRGSTGKAYNRCRKCGGRGERVRPVSRIYPRWNEEAKKR